MRTLRVIEEWTGHRKPRRTMKLNRFLLAITGFFIGIAIMVLTGCAVEETTTTTTDAKSGLVTVEKKITKKADKDALGFAGDVFAAYAPPRARRIREEKSGKITSVEIQNRWKPLP